MPGHCYIVDTVLWMDAMFFFYAFFMFFFSVCGFFVFCFGLAGENGAPAQLIKHQHSSWFRDDAHTLNFNTLILGLVMNALINSPH